ncbi:MAG: NAD(P)H-hydrate dehydratase [Gemmatimonadota bacterium]
MKSFAGPPLCLDPGAMAAVDRAATVAGLPGAALMESAGRETAREIRRRWPRPGRAGILVGGGNNGGDGLVVARYLVEAGWAVELRLFLDPDRLSGDAALQWTLIEPMGLPRRMIREAGDPLDPTDATVLVDALLGTGLKGDVREPMRSAILAVQAGSVPVVAVDTPSGLDGATGQVRGVACRATVTVTYGFPKPGLLLADGPAHVGRLVAVPLGYPPAALEAAGPTPLCWTTLESARRALPPRRHDDHKGDAGRLLVVAGSERFRGAVVLTAAAALRSGAGLCVVATPAPVSEFLLAQVPEAIVVALPVTKAGALATRSVDLVARAVEDADAVAVGPGLTTGRHVRELVEAALAAPLPVVVDADGLNVLARDPRPVRRDPATILTPHPGELGRWFGRDAFEVDAGRVDAARYAARQHACRVILKGSPTVIAGPDGEACLNLTGNPGLATGGSGDVLTGVLGSLLAQGAPAALADRAAPLLHGLAADWAALDLGERGLVPSDLLRYVPLAIREVSAGRGAGLLDRLDHRYAELLTATGERA